MSFPIKQDYLQDSKPQTLQNEETTGQLPGLHKNMNKIKIFIEEFEKK